MNETDGATFSIQQGGSRPFRATDPDGDTISYEISNNPSGIGIDSNTGLVVAALVSVGYSITVKASSTNADGSTETDTETYTINVTAASGGGGSGGGNSVNADFDLEGAGFSTLTGVALPMRTWRPTKTTSSKFQRQLTPQTRLSWMVQAVTTPFTSGSERDLPP